MQFNTREINGSRVRLRYRVELDYQVEGQSEFLLNVHAAHTAHQQIIEEAFIVLPRSPVAVEEDAVLRNRIASFHASGGTIGIRYAATAVEDCLNGVVLPAHTDLAVSTAQ